MDNMQLWLSSSTDSINLNDSAEGFYLNPDLEGLTGLPEIRSVNGLNAGYDGGWTATQLWAARLITIRGVIAINDKAAVETKRKALAKLLAQGKSEDLELRFVSEAGNTYTTTVRTTGCTMALQRVFWRQEYQIQLRANDPLIYDDGGSELVAILRVMAGEGGFEIPFDIPFAIGGSIEPTSVDVGDEATYPLIRLKGDLHNPTIINMTTNQRMQVLADIIATVEWRDYTTTYTTDGFAQISDGLDGAPLSLTHLYGNATQETYTGKNLMPVLNIERTINNVKFTPQADGSVLVNGTNNTVNYAVYVLTFNTAEYNVYRTVPAVAGTYYISNEGTIPSGVYVQCFTQITGQSVIQHNADGVFTVAEGFNFGCAIRVDAGTTVNNLIVKPMVEKNNAKTSWEPYVGSTSSAITPSPNPDYPQDVKTVSGAQTVRIVGKNIAAISNRTATNHGITYEFKEDGTIILNGTSDAITSQNATLDFPIRIKAGQVYTFSANNAEINTNIIIRLQKGNGQSGVFASGDLRRANNTWSFTGPNDCDCLVQVRIASGITLDNLTFRPQLELGNTANAFEQYQSQSQVIDLVISKNRFSGNFSQFNNRGGIGSAYAYFKLPDDDEYILSLKAKNNVPAQSQQVFIGFSADGGQSGGGVRWVWTNSTTASAGDVKYANNLPSGAGENMHFVSLYAPTEATLQWFVENFYIQLEKGTSPTDYEAYNTLELAKIGSYQDYIWNDNGTWKIHKAIHKIVLDGYTETTWSIRNTGTARYYYRLRYLSDVHYMADGSEWISDRLSLGTVGETTTDEGCFIVNGGELRIRYGTEMSLTDWKDYLKDHNITLYYQAETPTDIEITDSELIEQLNHIYELYQGTNNLWLIPSAGAQGEMEVSYASVKDVDYHEVVIDCQARTVTQDGHNLYPALAEGSEFIRLLPGENKLYLTSEVESDNGTAEVKFKKGNISI